MLGREGRVRSRVGSLRECGRIREGVGLGGWSCWVVGSR